MTFDERVEAVTTFGFTERQAAFLVTVMLHAGVCLGRHYCTFAGLAYGRKMHDFFERVVDRSLRHSADLPAQHGAAVSHPQQAALCRHRRTGQSSPQTDRFSARRRTPDGARRRAGGSRSHVARDRVRQARPFHAQPSGATRDLPSLTFRAEDCETVRYFPDKLPIAVDTDDRGHLFLYLVTRLAPIDFRAFLERHAELLRALPAWTLRLLVPRHLAGGVTAYHAAFREHVAMPLAAGHVGGIALVLSRAPSRLPWTRNSGSIEAARAFSAPRFQALYRAWLERGDPVLEATLSPVLRDAIERRTGRIEHHVLPHHYLHLSPLVGTA